MRTVCVWLLLFALLASVASAASARSRSRVVSLSHVRRVNAHDTVNVLIAVKQRHLTELADTCAQVSDPKHEQYGAYRSLDEVAAMVGNPSAVQRVVAWAKKHKAMHVEVVPTNDFVRARLPAQAVEKELKIQLHLFRHPKKQSLVMRSYSKYTLPTALRGLVDHIVGVEPVDLTHPTTIQPIGPRHTSSLLVHPAPAPAHPRSRPPKHHRGGARDSSQSEVTLDELSFVDASTVSFAIDQQCSDGNLGDVDWPCSDTENPIASYSVAVRELKSNKTTTYNITEETAKNYNWTFNEWTWQYTFQLHAVEQYGHYQFTLWSTGEEGDVSPSVAFPGDPYDVPDYFVVNYVKGVPSLFHSLYNIPASVPAAANNSLAMAAFMGETYSADDLDKYLKEYKIDASSRNVHVLGYAGDHGGDETMLDLDMEANVAPNVPLYYIYTGADDESMDFLLEWSADMSAMAAAPLVHSVSYGLPESMYEQYFGIAIDVYAGRTNAELQKLCVRGITVVVASGDGGSTDMGHGGESCELAPMYPASSPWVTTVGATAVDTWAGHKSTGAPGEVVVSITNGQFWTSGGGFSQLASQPLPSWQAAAVQKYVKTAPYLPKGCNTSFRAFPDISALGDAIMVVVDLTDGESGGTSASSPMVAGMIAHLNAARLAAGEPVVGFFNPLLYAIYAEHPEVFFDVTIGEISCGDEVCCPTNIGYTATAGWDVPSGVGSVNDLQALTRAVMQY